MRRLTMFAAAIVAAVLAPGLAAAHSGGMAGDGCHTDTKGRVGPVGEVHWHVPDTADRGGPCVGKERPRLHAVERDGYLIVETVKEVVVEVIKEVPVPGPDCEAERFTWRTIANGGGYFGHKADVIEAGWQLHACAAFHPRE